MIELSDVLTMASIAVSLIVMGIGVVSRINKNTNSAMMRVSDKVDALVPVVAEHNAFGPAIEGLREEVKDVKGRLSSVERLHMKPDPAE